MTETNIDETQLPGENNNSTEAEEVRSATEGEETKEQQTEDPGGVEVLADSQDGASDSTAEQDAEAAFEPATETETAASEETAEAEKAEEDDTEDEDDTEGEGGEEASFADLFEESLERIQEGSVVSGVVVQVTSDYVVVDVGAKSEGQIPIHEFATDGAEPVINVGDTVEVLLESSEDDEGGIRLSRSKAARIKVWEKIAQAYKEGETISGTISSRVKGGLQVDVGVPAFLPGSQIDLRPVRDMESLIGQTFDFKVLKYSKKRSNVVLSRRVLLEEEREAKKAELLKVLEEGAVLEGVVKNITDYGVFIDLGGMDGLLHITDISWGRVGHPSERFSIGDKVTVKVLNFDRERERVSLGMKQLKPDPWESVLERYPVASRVEGKVVSLTDYGAFVEVEEGVEGLVHVSEMSWTRKIRHPSKVVQVGDEVEVVVLNVDPERKRISLGIKQTVPDPWETIDERYPVGTTIEGRIKNVTDFGVFIGIEDGIDGLVHISDLSWSKRVKHPSDLYSKGDVVKAVVLNIDKENRRFSLGIKQAQIDPWESVAERYPVGSVVEGEVTNITDFGVFVEIEPGVEGLIHISEIAKEKIDSPAEKFEVGEKVSSKVVHLSPTDRRIGLSIRRLEEDVEEGSYQDYLRSRQQEATSNLGELIMSQLNEKNQEQP